MKKALLLASILCLLSSAFGQPKQQPQQKRTNYVSYEMNAGGDNLIQIVINIRLNAMLLDDDNFQKYKNGVDYRQLSYGMSIQTATNPTYIVPPKKQHWHLVLDNGGRPLAGNAGVRLYSLVGDLPRDS